MQERNIGKNWWTLLSDVISSQKLELKIVHYYSKKYHIKKVTAKESSFFLSNVQIELNHQNSKITKKSKGKLIANNSIS